MKFRDYAGAAIVAACLTTTSLVGAADAREPNLATVQAFDAPTVTLGHWMNSNDDLRYSFLLGFVSAIDLERTWQTTRPISLSNSLVRGWSTGFEGRSLRDLDATLKRHAQMYPQDEAKPVLQILWQDLVQPKLSAQMRQEVRNAYYGNVVRGTVRR